jgi:hypothetical protein
MHAGETQRAAGAHGVDGGLADGGPAEKRGRIKRGQQRGALVEVARHHAEAGSDDAAGIAALGEDIHRGGRAHADDHRRRARDELRADAVREAVLADLASVG